jgi:predicted histidine transporter YuiF (NhaC family)
MFNQYFEDFLRTNLKDAASAEFLIKENRKRANITMIVMVAFALLTFAAVAYAQYQRSSISDSKQATIEIENQIQICVQEARAQALRAQSVTLQTQEMFKETTEQLKNCK